APSAGEGGAGPADPGARRENIGNIRPTSNAERWDASPVECSGIFTTGSLDTCRGRAARESRFGRGVRDGAIDQAAFKLAGGHRPVVVPGDERARFALEPPAEFGLADDANHRRGERLGVVGNQE